MRKHGALFIAVSEEVVKQSYEAPRHFLALSSFYETLTTPLRVESRNYLFLPGREMPFIHRSTINKISSELGFRQCDPIVSWNNHHF